MTDELESGIAAAPALGGSMMRGAAWMVAARWVARLIGLCSTLVLARLLTPEDFGLVAIATSAVAVLDALSDFRFGTALVKYQDATVAEYNTAWTFNLLRGLILALVIAAAGPLLGYLYKDPRLENIVLVIAAVAVIQGAFNIGTVDFLKDLRFHSDFKFLVLSKLATSATTIGLAFLLRNYWALIGGNLAGNILGLVLSYCMSPFRPRPSLSAWRRLFGFSIWLMGAGIVTSILQQMNNVILGVFVPARVVGLYTVGHDLGVMVTGELTAPLSRVLFPGFSKITGESARLLEAYQRSIEVLCAVGLPLGIGFALVAREATLLILGEQWTDAVPVVQVVAVLAAINLMSTGSTSILPALGRTKQMFQISFATLLLGLPLSVLGAYLHGLTGVLIAGVISGSFWSWTHLIVVARALSTSALTQVVKCWRSFTSSVVMGVGVLAIGQLLEPEMNIWFGSLIKVLAGVFLYTACHLTLWIVSRRPIGPENLVIDFLGSFRSPAGRHI